MWCEGCIERGHILSDLVPAAECGEPKHQRDSRFVRVPTRSPASSTSELLQPHSEDEGNSGCGEDEQLTNAEASTSVTSLREHV